MNIKKNNKKIYVTGVSGFIGSRIAEIFVKLGYSITGITKNNKFIKAKEMPIKILKNDLVKNKFLKLKSADAIIHCATANNIISKNFEAGFNLSVMGTKKLLDAAVKAKIKNLIFFSTIQVYGTNLVGNINENSSTNCTNSYSLNHLYGEELCKMYSKEYGLNIVVVRPSNVYGFPFIKTINRSTLVPMCFINEAIKKNQINILSSGKQMRNFISTDQVAFLINSILKKFPTGFNVVNIGSNYYASIINISNIVAKVFKEKLNKKVVINIKGKFPKRHNLFKFRSKKYNSLDNKLVCQKKMIETINLSIEKFKNEKI